MVRMTQQNSLFHSRDRDHIHRKLLSPSALSIVVRYQEDEMVQDAERLDGLPPVASPDASGPYSPCSNVHLKHEYSLCTTQASLEAITDINPSLNGAYSPTTVPPQAHETRRSAAVTASSHDCSYGTDRPERGGSSPTHQHLGLGLQYEEYSPEDLPQRMQDFQASHSTDFDGYNPDTVSQPAAESVSISRPSLVYSVNNRIDGLPLCDLDVQTQPGEGWAAWEPCAPPEKDRHRRPVHRAGRFDLASSAEGAQATSFPYSAAASGPGQPYQNIRGDDISFPPTSTYGTYKHHSPADAIPMTRLSPCSSTLAMGSDAICIRREDTAPLSDPDIDMDADMVYNPSLYDAEDVIGSRSSTEPAGGKSDEPYAQLIYRAFMSRPNKSMTLQEIYQWFRENTDKAKSTGKGWQNSIRHNLSMNGAFTKRCSNQPALNSDGSLSLDASAVDGRKSTEWYLEPKYYGGVESTTRYRKGNSKGAVRAHHRGDRAVHGNVKAVSGRKGGYQAAHNRKRTKAEQQQEAARQRNQRLQQCGPHFYTDEDGRYYPEYPRQLSPNTSSPYQVQASQGLKRQAGMPPSRQAHLNINYFQSEFVGNAHGTHEKGLSSDVDPATEPTTPPGSEHDSQVGDLSYGNKYHHPYLPGFFTNTDGSYHHPAAVAAAALSPPVYPQQSGYTLHQVEGIFEAPAGIETPLFLSGNNLTGEEAAALMAASPPWANVGPYC